jgi:hypothetical protein
VASRTTTTGARHRKAPLGWLPWLLLGLLVLTLLGAALLAKAAGSSGPDTARDSGSASSQAEASFAG